MKIKKFWMGLLIFLGIVVSFVLVIGLYFIFFSEVLGVKESKDIEVIVKVDNLQIGYTGHYIETVKKIALNDSVSFLFPYIDLSGDSLSLKTAKLTVIAKEE